jgi:Tfp pilus assembly protein PilX
MSDDMGAALVMVIGWMLVVGMLVTSAIAYAIQTNVVSHKGQDWGAAQAAAMAGIEDYVARLNRNDSYARTWDCTNVAMKGPNQAGNTCGWSGSTPTGWVPVVANNPVSSSFHYDIDASSLDSRGEINVTSTGRSGTVTRTVETVVGREGSTDFLYYTDLEHADPANQTVYSSPPTKYFCGSTGAQKDIYWWSPKISGENRANSGCTEIGFAAGDVLNGPVHFNDTPVLNNAGTKFLNGFETSDPACKGAVSASTYYLCLRSGSPTPVYGTASVPSKPVWAEVKYLDDTSAKFATFPGCHYYGSTRIIFKADGTMTVWSKDSVGKSTGTNCGTFTAGTWAAGVTVPVPNEQVIYDSAGPSIHRCVADEIGGPTSPSDRRLPLGSYTGSNTTSYTYDITMLNNDQFCGMGNLYIEGTIKGRVTIATENSIVATGDLVLANGINGQDLVGLVAGNSVQVFHPWIDTWQKPSGTWGWANSGVEDNTWPTRYVDPGQSPAAVYPTSGIQIDASIQTLQHSFFVQQYNKGPGEGTLMVWGSIAQRWRGIVGTGSGTGYIKSYNYDARLKYSSPPYFPQWSNAKWAMKHTGENKPAYNAAGTYLG